MTGILENILFLGFLFSLSITLVVTPIVIKLAMKFGFVDDPKKHKHPAILHKQIIPRAGGLAIGVGIISAILMFVPVNKQIVGIISASILAIIVGVLDDKYDLNPYIRFLSNFAVAAIVVLCGIGISFITNPLGGVIQLDDLILRFNIFGPHSIVVFADLFAIIWIVWVMNMLNWSKGVDGQLAGIAGIGFTVLGLTSLRFSAADPSQTTVALLSFIAAGASFGFLPFNWHPAKIFPGYSSTVLGFLIAVLSIMSGAKVAIAVLVMAVPLLDGGFTIARRLLMKRSPFWGDKGHLHHQLIKLGWGHRKISLFYWVVCVILGSIALMSSSVEKFFTALLVLTVLIGMILWINLTIWSKQEEKD